MSPTLTCRTIATTDLTALDIESMFSVFNENFEGATVENFKRDLNNKNWVIQLYDSTSGEIQGFSTLALYETMFKEKKVSVVYSGDTIIRPAYWGTPELPKSWIHTVLEKSANMQQPVYWLLISSGYKTYRFLTVFYKEFYPCHHRSTPPEMKDLMDHLACERFGDEYHLESGVVRFRESATPLRKGVAEVTDERLKDEDIAFYLEKNPHHDQGDELVCITRIHPDNFTPAGRRMAR